MTVALMMHIMLQDAAVHIAESVVRWRVSSVAYFVLVTLFSNPPYTLPNSISVIQRLVLHYSVRFLKELCIMVNEY